jgi:hypothetical protein
MWIDALCIIQDSVEDWEAEAMKMSQVYSHGWVNLAAAASSSSHEGLFRDRHPFSIYPVPADICWPEYLKGSFYCVSKGQWKVTVDASPLLQRGVGLPGRITSWVYGDSTFFFFFYGSYQTSRKGRKRAHHRANPCLALAGPGRLTFLLSTTVPCSNARREPKFPWN